MRMSRVSAGFGLAMLSLLLLAAATAFADDFEVPNAEKGLKLVWRPMTITPTLGPAVRCNVTLTGSFHSRTFAKTAGLNVGTISAATLRECTSGSATVLTASLPWRLLYKGTTGSLPTIETVSFDLAGMSASAISEGTTCLLATEARRPLPLTGLMAPWTEQPEEGGSGKIMPEVRADERTSIGLAGAFPCSFATATVSGTATSTTQVPGFIQRLAQPIAVGTMALQPSPLVIPPERREGTMRVHNLQAEGGLRFIVREIGLSNAASFELSDPNFCSGSQLLPDRNCAFTPRYKIGARPIETRVIAVADRAPEQTATVRQE